jgi:PKHD-type hydroxylase
VLSEPYDIKLTAILNISTEAYEGGDFELIVTSLDSPVTIPKEKGKLIIFPSFLFHRVTPVTRGVRKSLVSWIYGPKFK